MLADARNTAGGNGGVDEVHAHRCAQLPRCLPGLHLRSVGCCSTYCLADGALPRWQTDNNQRNGARARRQAPRANKKRALRE
eukprot:3730176-Alexandrium_andersonii.AAC.1